MVAGSRGAPGANANAATLLGEHGLGLLVGEEDLVDGVAAVLEGLVVVVDVRGDEDLWVPSEALARRQVRDQAGRALGITNVDDGALLLRDRRTQQTGPPGVAVALALALGGAGGRGGLVVRGRGGAAGAPRGELVARGVRCTGVGRPGGDGDGGGRHRFEPDGRGGHSGVGVRRLGREEKGG